MGRENNSQTDTDIHINRMEASGAKRMYFEFHEHTFIGEFSKANVSFGCKGKAAKT